MELLPTVLDYQKEYWKNFNQALWDKFKKDHKLNTYNRTEIKNQFKIKTT
jgi:hypothetical protein